MKKAKVLTQRMLKGLFVKTNYNSERRTCEWIAI